MRNMQVKINQLGVLFCALFFLSIEPLAGQSKPLLASPEVENPKSVLFIGNSFFYYNNGVHKPVLGMVKANESLIKTPYDADVPWPSKPAFRIKFDAQFDVKFASKLMYLL